MDEKQARGYCRTLLEESGFTVREQAFEFSAGPGRWGPSLGALLAAISVWAAAHIATRHHAPWLGLFVNLAGLGAVSVAGYLMARYGVAGLPIDRCAATNLVATPSASELRPVVWLIAHIDSKSQTIPMVVRVGASIVFALMSAGVMASLVIMCVFGLNDQPDNFMGAIKSVSAAASILSWMAAAAALPIILCFVGNRSLGALDNATGVASVILAAGILGDSANIGVVITSGEELGLAGARHFTATETEAGIAINCDTIDDYGKFICMASGARMQRLDGAIDRAASKLQFATAGRPGRSGRGALRLRGMIPGILADNIAFTDAGWESFTLSRGNIATLGYVHTSRDVPDRITGTGIAQAASFIAAIVQELG